MDRRSRTSRSKSGKVGQSSESQEKCEPMKQNKCSYDKKPARLFGDMHERMKYLIRLMPQRSIEWCEETIEAIRDAAYDLQTEVRMHEAAWPPYGRRLVRYGKQGLEYVKKASGKRLPAGLPKLISLKHFPAPDFELRSQPDDNHMFQGQWYCENQSCVVREVLVSVKLFAEKEPSLLKCPACSQGPLTFHGYNEHTAAYDERFAKMVIDNKSRTNQIVSLRIPPDGT